MACHLGGILERYKAGTSPTYLLRKTGPWLCGKLRQLIVQEAIFVTLPKALRLPMAPRIQRPEPPG